MLCLLIHIPKLIVSLNSLSVFSGCNMSTWERSQDCQPVKTSVLSWPICQKKSEGVIDLFPCTHSANFPPHFLSFLFLKLTSNKSYFFWVPATCQHQHHSQYDLQCPPSLYKDPFLGFSDNTGICQACLPPAFIFWVTMSPD